MNFIASAYIPNGKWALFRKGEFGIIVDAGSPVEDVEYDAIMLSSADYDRLMAAIPNGPNDQARGRIIREGTFVRRVAGGFEVVPGQGHEPKPLRHEYRPHPKYPWFCEECGYPRHDRMKHSES
jgi:hypothetical protein